MTTKRSTTSKIGVRVDPAPATTAQQVSFAPTVVRPTALGEFASQITPVLQKHMALAAAKSSTDTSLIGVVNKHVKQLSNQIDSMREQGTLDVKSFSKAKREALLGLTTEFSQSGSSRDAITNGLTMYSKIIDDIFPDTYVQTDTIKGVPVTVINGETTLSKLSAENIQAQTLIDIADTMPQFAHQLSMGLQGLNPDGTQAKNPEKLKQETRALMYKQAVNLNRLEVQVRHNEALGEAFKSVEFDYQRKELVAKNNRANTISSFWETAGNIVEGIRLQPGADDMPLEQKLNALKVALMDAAHSPQYEEQAILLQEPQLFTNLVKEQMEVAKGIFEATDKITKMKWDNAKKETLKKAWNLSFELGLGKKMLPLLSHAEAFKNFNGAVLDANTIDQNVDRPTLQVMMMKAIATGGALDTYDMALRTVDGARETSSATAAVEDITARLAKSLRDYSAGTGSLTDVGVYKMLLDTMAAPGVKRYLRNPDVPADVRQQFKDMLLKAEQKLQRATGKSREDVELIYDKRIPIDSIFDPDTELPGAPAEGLK